MLLRALLQMSAIVRNLRRTAHISPASEEVEFAVITRNILHFEQGDAEAADCRHFEFRNNTIPMALDGIAQPDSIHGKRNYFSSRDECTSHNIRIILRMYSESTGARWKKFTEPLNGQIASST